MPKYRIFIIFLSLMLIFAMSGCADQDDQEEKAAPTQTEAEAETENNAEQDERSTDTSEEGSAQDRKAHQNGKKKQKGLIRLKLQERTLDRVLRLHNLQAQAHRSKTKHRLSHQFRQKNLYRYRQKMKLHQRQRRKSMRCA